MRSTGAGALRGGEGEEERSSPSITRATPSAVIDSRILESDFLNRLPDVSWSCDWVSCSFIDLKEPVLRLLDRYPAFVAASWDEGSGCELGTSTKADAFTPTLDSIDCE